MRNTLTNKSIIVLLFSLLSTVVLEAQSIISREYFAQHTDFNTILVDVQDGELGNLLINNIDFRDKNPYAVVNVGFDPDMHLCYDNAVRFKITVSSEETIIDALGNVSTPLPQFYTLTVNYDPNRQTIEAEQAFVAIPNARALKLTIVEVKSVAPDGTETTITTPDNLPGDLFVEGEILRERYMNFDPTASGSTPTFNTIPFSNYFDIYLEHNVHYFTWDNVDGAAEYELEWTYEDDFDETGVSNSKPDALITVKFKNNASSVRLKRQAVNSFYIPEIYARGHLICRLRAIGRGGPDLEDDIFGPWSLAEELPLLSVPGNSRRYCQFVGDNVLFNGFNNLNSQYAVQFAEEGKIMASGTYADGSMRVIQNTAAVKIDYTQEYGKKAVITETIYDHMGRAAITTLPAVTKSGFWYTPNYNRNTSGQKYSYLDFDTDDNLEGGCVTEGSPMAVSSGSSLYYSPDNPIKTDLQGLVANAERYPFIQNIFERDNTNRPKIQSGVGIDHRMGSGHETKYVYGGAEAIQLNRLFGTDAGYAEYYQKNMIIDANGQISITYTDMAGRTVATSLAGKVPDNVESLKDGTGNALAENGEVIEDDMLNKSDLFLNGSSNMLSPDGTSYTFSKTLLIDKEQNYTFTYAAALAEFQDSCFTFCLDCIYDLEISLTDECGQYLIGSPDSLSPLHWTIGGNTMDTLCNDSSIIFTLPEMVIPLKPGSYMVHKKLSINPDSLDVFVEKMLANSTCLLTPEDFYQAPDTSGCYMTCEGCMANIGTWEEFFTDEKIDSSFGGDSTLAYQTLWPVYVSMKLDCEAICAPENTRDFCSSLYALMLMDIAPGGQYGQYDDISTPDLLSVYNPSNILPFRRSSQFYALPSGSTAAINSIDGQIPSWRKPVYYDRNNATIPYKIGYYDIFGEREKVYIQLDDNDDFQPAVVNPSLVYTISEIDNQYYTYHENLANLDDFLADRPSQLAKSLVIYHPEFIQYTYCASIYPYTNTVNGHEVNTFNFDDELENLSYLQAGTLLGSPSTVADLFNAISAIDPYFDHPLITINYGVFPDFSPSTLIENKFLQFQHIFGPVNIAQMSYIQNTCGYNYPVGCTLPTNVWGGLIHDADTWGTFVSYYTSLKQEIILNAMNLHGLLGPTPDDPLTWNSIVTNCIGNNAYFPSQASISSPSTPMMENPCNFPFFIFYHQKQKRISTTTSQISEEFGLSDPPTVEELQQHALQDYYNQTGKCTMVSDLEFLLGKLTLQKQTVGGAPKLTASLLNLSEGGFMGNALYTHIGGTADVMYSANITGNTLTASAGDMTCPPFRLTLPAAAITAGYNFDDIQSMYGITQIVPGSGTEHTFSVMAIFYDAGIGAPETLAVAGFTCLPLTGCEGEFKSICKPTPVAKDLVNLLSNISMEGDLFHTGTPLSLTGLAYNALITPRLKLYLGNNSHTWLYDATNEVFILAGNMGSLQLNVPSAGLGLNPSDTYEFLSVAGPFVTTTGNVVYPDFVFSAKKVNMGNYLYPVLNTNPIVTMSGSVTVVGGSQTFPITECKLLKPLDCNTLEHNNLDELREVFELDVLHDVSLTAFQDSCAIQFSPADSTIYENAVEIISLEADMELSQNGVNSYYFTLVVKDNLGNLATIKGKSCKALRNCVQCTDENEGCNPGDVSIKIGPLSGITMERVGYYSLVNNSDNCNAIKPFDFQYLSPSFWNDWAQAIRDSMGSGYTVSVEDDYMTITFNSADSKCNCSNDESYSLLLGESVVATYPITCCTEVPCEATLMDFSQFPEGWFGEQTTFAQVFWGEKTDNSLIYEDDDLLIFENNCQAIIKTATMNWDMSAIYRISCEFIPFNTPDPVESIQLSFFDATGSWLESIDVNSAGPKVFYYTPSQTDMQFGVDIQNVDWDVPGGVCAGSSKVGLKYLKIEQISAPYHTAQIYTANEGISSTDIAAPGATLDVLGLKLVDEPSLGISGEAWIDGNEIHLISPCGTGLQTDFEICSGYTHEVEITIGAPDPAFSASHIYLLIFGENTYADMSGPYTPGTITHSFTPTDDGAVSIVAVAVNATTTPNLMAIMGGTDSFSNYCRDSVHLTFGNFIMTQGCNVGYACGEAVEPPSCYESIYSVSTFPEGWFENQDEFTVEHSQTGNSSVYEENGKLILFNDCASNLRKEFTNTVPGALYRVVIELAEFNTLDVPTADISFGTLADPGLYYYRALKIGYNEFYFESPSSSWYMSLLAGNFVFTNTTPEIACYGSSKLGINSISVERMNDAHEVVQTPLQNVGINSATLSIPGITPQMLGFINVHQPEKGITETETWIDDAKLYVTSSCASVIKTPMDVCVDYTQQMEITIEAPDPNKAPTYIGILVMNEDAGYTEFSGPYTPGLIQFEFTPPTNHVEVVIVALHGSTNPNIYAILNDDTTFQGYCSDSVLYYISSTNIVQGCIPSYRCTFGGSQDTSVWASSEPFSLPEGCHPDILPFPTDTTPQQNPCVQYLLQTAQANADFAYNEYLDQMREEYRRLYIEKCMQPVRETFKRVFTDGQYHYTLYYYDRAGNLVKTVPPHAVEPLTGTTLAAVNNARDNGTVNVPNHNIIGQDGYALSTRYRYNSLNQPVEQITPDGGKSNFYYDRLGRVVVSQNAVQQSSSKYSYTLYDPLGRIAEVGQFGHATVATRTNVYESGAYTAGGTGHTEITRTHYDVPCTTYTFVGGFAQNNLRSRVSYTEVQPIGETNFKFATFYNYDIHGNVKALIHQNLYAPATLEQNLVEYDYDLVSGVVKRVAYNKHRADRYFHRYGYDDQNRLTHAYTSRNDVKYDLDARYFYYHHGPLARTELGNNKIQGVDYAYTIHGWLKTLNSDALESTIDPSRDGYNDVANNNRYFARDAYGLSLHYHSGDYSPIETSYEQTKTLPSAYNTLNLFNGNISAMNNTLKKPGGGPVYGVRPLLQRFGYDQLNRIKSSDAFDNYDVNNNQWDASSSPLDIYATSYKYDPAGNLLELSRNGDNTTLLEMDRLHYEYYDHTNQLKRVEDPTDENNYDVDIDGQDPLEDNYVYDLIGNLIEDKAEGIEEIKWTVYGKVSEVKCSSLSGKPDLKFFYDAGGKRIMKKIIPKNGAPEKTEFYVHDAQGNPLTIYTYLASSTPTYKVNEQMIYGSSRIGLWKSDLDLLAYIPEVPEILVVDRGNKRYEMNDHLSNVHAVVSDRKNRICDEGTLTHYEADIQNLYDYYAFGMLMPGREYTAPVTPPPAQECPLVPQVTTNLVYWLEFDNSTESFASVSGSIVTNVAGKLKVEKTTCPTKNSCTGWGTSRTISLPAGTEYQISFDLNKTMCTNDILVEVKDGSTVLFSNQYSTNGNQSFTFNSASTATSFAASIVGNEGCSFELDNLLITTKDTTYQNMCCDTIIDSLAVVLLEEDFSDVPPAWSLFEETVYPWYKYSDDSTHVSGGRLMLEHPTNNPSSTQSTYVGILNISPAVGQTLYYSFDLDWDDCNLDSILFWPHGAQDAIHVTTNGHVELTYTVQPGDDFSLMAFSLYGDDTCTAYMDNFKIWYYQVDTSINCCSADTLFPMAQNFGSGVGGFVSVNSAAVANASGKLQVSGTSDGVSAVVRGVKNIFEATAGKEHSLTFMLEMGCGSPTPESLTVNIKDGSGTVIATQGFAVVNDLCTLTFTPPSSGTYTLELVKLYSNPTSCTFYIDDVNISYVNPCQQDETDLFASSYRFGYNGMEKVDEIYGDANAYDFGARIYDPRLGRFLAIDPLAAKYPGWSPYSFAIDNPIKFIDVNGNGPGDGLRKTYTAVVQIETSKGVYETVYLAKRYYENVTTAQAAAYKREAQTPNGWYKISKAEYEAQHGREGHENPKGRVIGAKDPNPDALTERVNGADTPKKRVDFVNNAAQGDYMDGQPLAVTNRTGTATINIEGSIDANGNPVTETISFSILDAAGNVLSTQEATIAGPGEIKFDFNLKEDELVSFRTTATQGDRGYTINATTRAAKGDDRAPDTIGDYGTEEPTNIDINAIKKKIK